MAKFTASTEEWTEPVIGWAVVAGHELDGEDGTGAETRVEAVVLAEERFPQHITEYLDDLNAGHAKHVSIAVAIVANH
jgi:hypothetical protein